MIMLLRFFIQSIHLELGWIASQGFREVEQDEMCIWFVLYIQTKALVISDIESMNLSEERWITWVGVENPISLIKSTNLSRSTNRLVTSATFSCPLGNPIRTREKKKKRMMSSVKTWKDILDSNLPKFQDTSSLEDHSHPIGPHQTQTTDYHIHHRILNWISLRSGKWNLMIIKLLAVVPSVKARQKRGNPFTLVEHSAAITHPSRSGTKS